MDQFVLNMNRINDMNMMNRPFPKALSMLIVVLLISPVLKAQPDGRPGGVDREALRERMEVMAVGFLTEELELDAESAQVFWPIYNAHKKQLDNATAELQDLKKALGHLEGGSQEEFDSLLDRLEQAELRLPQLRAQFLRDVATEFGPEFAVRCVEAQKKFKDVVRQRMQQRMSGANGRRPGGRQRRP